MPEPDALTVKAQEVYMWMARWPFVEQGIDLDFIFKLVGLEVGSEESKAVYDLVLTRIELEREHQARRQGKASP